MGTLRMAIAIGDPHGERWTMVEALVDTGASYTWIPQPVLEALGVTPTFRFPCILAAGRRTERPLAAARARFAGQERTTLVDVIRCSTTLTHEHGQELAIHKRSIGGGTGSPPLGPGLINVVSWATRNTFSRYKYAFVGISI